MLGPFTPTLLALLTRAGLLNLSTRGLGTAGVAGKVAVITGAASGIGAALARRCAKDGAAALVLADNAWHTEQSHADAGHGQPSTGAAAPASPMDHHPLLAELDNISGGAVSVLPLTIDVSSQDDLSRLHDESVAAFGAPHVLFNNAGTGMPGVLSATDEALQRAVDINFWSVIRATRMFVPTFESHGPDVRCCIVNTASLAGVSEAAGLYGVTKHAVVAATEAVASELAWRKSNVEVSVLCPSYVASNVIQTTRRAALETTTAATASTQAFGAAMDAATEERVERELAGLPLLVQHGMHPDDVADITMRGIVQGLRYIYTDQGHAEAAIADRVAQLRAGGLPAAGFVRRMEQVVADGLAAARRVGSTRPSR